MRAVLVLALVLASAVMALAGPAEACRIRRADLTPTQAEIDESNLALSDLVALGTVVELEPDAQVRVRIAVDETLRGSPLDFVQATDVIVLGCGIPPMDKVLSTLAVGDRVLVLATGGSPTPVDIVRADDPRAAHLIHLLRPETQ